MMEENTLKDKRITELDFAKGIAILCVVAIHYFAVGQALHVLDVEWGSFFWAVKQYGGAFFVLISGLCAKFGSRSVSRGIIAFLCGMLLTGVTCWLYTSGKESEEVLIQWGVLHCIGMCKILWPLFRKLSPYIRIAAGAAIVITGYYLMAMVHVRNPWLFPLGLRTWHFTAFDYFPLMPNLGWFLIGSGLGNIIYPERKPLFPSFKAELFAFCGRYSLYIYMLHMPLLYLYFRFWR